MESKESSKSVPPASKKQSEKRTTDKNTWIEAFQEIQRQTAKAQLTFQKTMAESHTAFQKHVEMTDLLSRIKKTDHDRSIVHSSQSSFETPPVDQLQSEAVHQVSDMDPIAPISAPDNIYPRSAPDEAKTGPSPLSNKEQIQSKPAKNTDNSVAIPKKRRKPSKFHVTRAEEKDSDDLNELMRGVSQESNMWEVITERQPNFLDSIMTLTPIPSVWIGRLKETNQPVGCASTGIRDVYVNGQIKSIRYASDIRIHNDHRGGELVSLIFMHGQSELKPKEMAQTHIITENETSLAALAAQYMYYEYGDFHMHMIIYFGFRKPPIESKYSVRRALNSDVGAMQAFFDEQAPKKQFYPHYDFHKIGTNDPYYRDIKLEDYYLAFYKSELVGMSGLWDQKGFKQTRFKNYHKMLRFFRPLYNVYAKVFRAFQFPAEMKLLQSASLHTILTKDNDVEIFKVILREVFRGLKNGKYRAFSFGLSPEDPLNEAVNEYRRITYLGKHFLIRFDGDPRPDLDDSRILYLELSRL